MTHLRTTRLRPVGKSKKVHLLILALMTLAISCSAGGDGDGTGGGTAGNPNDQIGNTTGFTEYKNTDSRTGSSGEGNGGYTTSTSFYLNDTDLKYKVTSKTRYTGSHEVDYDSTTGTSIFADFGTGEDAYATAEEGGIENNAGFVVINSYMGGVRKLQLML